MNGILVLPELTLPVSDERTDKTTQLEHLLGCSYPRRKYEYAPWQQLYEASNRSLVAGGTNRCRLCTDGAADVVELLTQAIAEHGEGDNKSDRDQRCDQTILNGGGSLLVV
jgi:hypothetical protein